MDLKDIEEKKKLLKEHIHFLLKEFITVTEVKRVVVHTDYINVTPINKEEKEYILQLDIDIIN